MRHVAILGDDLETLNRLGVTYYVVEVDGSVLLDPLSLIRSEWRQSGGGGNATHHGRSYVAALRFAVMPLRAPADDDSAFDIERR